MPSLEPTYVILARRTLGADGKDYRADYVHAPFPEKISSTIVPPDRGRRLSACEIVCKSPAAMTQRGTIMNANPQAAADQARAAYRHTMDQLGNLGLDTAVPEGVRALAEKSVAQTREAYDRSWDAFDASVTTFERSFDAAGQGAIAFNRKIIDIARRNVDASFDLATSLAGAKNLADIVERQSAFWRQQFSVLTAQAEEVRALSTRVTADAAEPIKAQVKRGHG